MLIEQDRKALTLSRQYSPATLLSLANEARAHARSLPAGDAQRQAHATAQVLRRAWQEAYAADRRAALA